MKFVNTLNRLIYKNVERMGADKNLTFALVQYQGGHFKLVGQHEDILIVRQGGQIERVSTMNLGFPVGLEPEIEEWVHAATITLQSGDGQPLADHWLPVLHKIRQAGKLCQVHVTSDGARRIILELGGAGFIFDIIGQFAPDDARALFQELTA